MRAEKRLDRRRMLTVWLGRERRVEECGEVLAGADDEPLVRVRHDVRVGAVRQLEAKGEAAWHRAGTIVGNVWDAASIRVAGDDRCRGRHQVRSAAQRRRAARRRERARHDNALGVSDTVAWVYATGERDEVIGDTLLEALVLPLQTERKASETADQADANRAPREHKRPPRRIVKSVDAIVAGH